METVRKVVSADILAPVIDLPWASKGLQVEVIVIPQAKETSRRREASRQHLTTKERIAAFGETTEDVQISEIDWGKPQGKEIW